MVFQRLYEEEARIFWVHNTGPLGCLPYSYLYHNSNPGNLDQNRCVKSQNEIAQEFNRQLKNKVSQLSTQLPHSAFTYVDVYSVKYQLISTARSQGNITSLIILLWEPWSDNYWYLILPQFAGFIDPMNFCCGSFYGVHIDCGKKAIVNGTVYGNPCGHPSMHISWDGIHYSEAANLWVANRILNGSHSCPAFSVEEACQLV